MDNVALILKGVGFAILAWIGVQVATSKIIDNAVTTAKINNGAVSQHLVQICP